MANWTNDRIENSLVKMVGKVTLGIATDATMHCIKIACEEVQSRINNATCAMDGKRVSPRLAAIAAKAAAL